MISDLLSKWRLRMVIPSSMTNFMTVSPFFLFFLIKKNKEWSYKGREMRWNSGAWKRGVLMASSVWQKVLMGQYDCLCDLPQFHAKRCSTSPPPFLCTGLVGKCICVCHSGFVDDQDLPLYDGRITAIIIEKWSGIRPSFPSKWFSIFDFLPLRP